MPTPPADRRSTVQARAVALAGTQAQHSVRTARAATTDADGAGEGTGAPPVRGELWLYGVVGGYWWGFSSDSVAYALRQLGDVDEIVVRLDSPGGVAMQGVSIGNLLANHDAHVTVVVDGMAASAASLIALGGDEVVMSPGSQFMLHDTAMLTWGNAADLRSDSEWLDKQSQNYAETYAHRAGGTAAQWREVMLADSGRGTWYSAQESVDAGLADRVANIASTGTPPAEPEPDEDGADGAHARAAFDLDVLVASTVRTAWTQQHPTSRRVADAHQPPSASAVGPTPTEGGSAVAFSDEQLTTMRTKLGLAEDADEATITAALTEALDERAEPTAGVPEGHVTIPRVQLDELTAGAAAGTQAAQSLHAMKREQFLDANTGKYAPANRASWGKEYDRDPVATAAHFKDAPTIVPTTELGHAEDADPAAPTSLAEIREDEGYKNWKVI